MMRKQEVPTRMFDIATMRAERDRRKACFIYGDREVSAAQYMSQAEALSRALIADGLRRGEAVAIVCDNRPEWNIVDVGVTQAGGVLLPLCKGLSAEEYVECLTTAQVRTLFIENEETLKRFRLLLPQVEMVEKVVMIDYCEGLTCLDELCRSVDNSKYGELARQRRDMVTTDDVCTLIYTGGGTYSKLTHRALLGEVVAITSNDTERRKSALGNNALCTRYGRTKNYACQIMGRTVRYPVH